MSLSKTQPHNYLLMNTAPANEKITNTISAPVAQLKNLLEYFPLNSSANKKIKMLCNEIDLRITIAAINRGLYFREVKRLALISGAGIAGLSASFELRARGFNVVIVEKRRDFSRFNIINLNVETQVFLKRFNLLEKFERFVAARIKEHRYVLIDKNGSEKRLAVSDVSETRLDESKSFEPKNFNKLFDQDGIYSVPIGTLQTFLAENALEPGVNIFGDVEAKILSRTEEGGVSKVQITADRTLKPDLFFIAEGAHSTTALQLGMKSDEVVNKCTGENWIFGNLTYSGKETFVVSIIDASNKILRIANVIFNAKSKAINVAVTSEIEVQEESIREQILKTTHQVFNQKVFPLEEMDSSLLTTVSKPVHVVNRTFSPFSIGNVYCIGDSAGSSSPLAGLGGTLGLTLVPLVVRQLLDDYDQQSEHIHKNFDEFTESYTSRWIQKSQDIKEFCVNIFDKEHVQAERG